MRVIPLGQLANGRHIKLDGEVEVHRNNLCLADGDTYTTFLINLEQRDTRPPLPNGR